MRITFLTPNDSLNGGVRVVALYARLLQARGHEVNIVSSPRPQPSLRERARALRRGRWQELRERHRPLPGHLAQSGVAWRELGRARRIVAADVPDADVVIATWWETAVWMASLPASKGAKVHLVQGYETWGDPDFVRRVDAALRLPNTKIAISRSLKYEIEASLGPLGMRVVANAVDSRQFDAPPRRRRSRPRVGFVYSQAPLKGPDRYLDIVNLARRELPELEVLAFGADEIGEAVPLPQRTDYHRRPAQTELASLYASCDVWLFSTRVDSFGLPVLEAMACRTPVVGLPVGAAPDLLDSGCGVLVRPESEKVLAAQQARALVDLLQAPESDWLEMSERAYRRAHGYSWEDAATRLEAELLQVVRPLAA